MDAIGTGFVFLTGLVFGAALGYLVAALMVMSKISAEEKIKRCRENHIEVGLLEPSKDRDDASNT